MGLVAQNLGGRVVSSALFPELSTLLGRIQETYRPVDIILYGSRARGEATAQSDWDLKVIVDDNAPDDVLSPMLGWTIQEGTGVHADVSCARLSDFQADMMVANSAASHIVGDGLVLLVD
ncbi:hypothetical protein BJF93_03275 [Xaviernesmea oryzae]|uniref:Polymerase nucleotidyl transferase domain-containing protein n=1 Tax=Xaviernesmea oryzae TaxID=464029 RepID=A0A1Q9AZF9_9HYPH|nr:nucleotidyltransferase domain-containing protein [Xaviernesmea oryzae]OLP61082.1 hypothetical protein BJF93_03275 [Xaviernesmea oryzae]